MEKYTELLNAIVAKNGHVVDDHRSEGRTLQLCGIALLVKGEKQIPVALCNSMYFSLNRLYLEDGVPHVSREAVAGVVHPHRFNGDVLAAIKEYNDEDDKSQFPMGTLQQINMFRYVPRPTFEALMSSKHFENKEERDKVQRDYENGGSVEVIPAEPAAE